MLNASNSDLIEEQYHDDAVTNGRLTCCLRTDSLIVRTYVLFVSAFFFFSCTLLDGLVSALVPTLKETMNITTAEVGFLYSATPVTAILTSLATTFLVGRIKVRTLSLLSTLALLIGNTIFVYSDNYAVKLVGRAVFGMGEGPLEVLMSLICIRWFEESDPLFPTLEVSFGFTAASGMFGAAAGLFAIPWIVEMLDPNVMFAYSLINMCGALTVIVAILFWLIDYWASPLLRLKNPTEENEQTPIGTLIKTLSLSYWILFVMCGSLWSIIYVIMVFLTDYIFEKWEYSNVYAGQIAGIVFLVAMVTSAISGWFVSRVGKVLTMLMLGGLLFTLSCLILSLTTFSPFIGVVGIGLATGLFEPTVYSSIARVLPNEGSDAAFTLTSLIFQSVIFVGPFLFGLVRDYSGSYDLVFLLCSLFGVVNVLLTIWLGFISPNLQNIVQHSSSCPKPEVDTGLVSDHEAVTPMLLGRRTLLYFSAFVINSLFAVLLFCCSIYVKLITDDLVWLKTVSVTGLPILLLCLGIAALANGIFNFLVTYFTEWNRWIKTVNKIYYLTLGFNILLVVYSLLMIVFLVQGTFAMCPESAAGCKDWLWLLLMTCVVVSACQVGFLCLGASHLCCNTMYIITFDTDCDVEEIGPLKNTMRI